MVNFTDTYVSVGIASSAVVNFTDRYVSTGVAWSSGGLHVRPKR